MKNVFVLLVFLFTLHTAKAQDYHHYSIQWMDASSQYFGVMAVNTHVPTQVLRLICYNRQTGEYRLLEEKFRLSFVDSRFYLASTKLSERTTCYDAYAENYNADNFYMIENGLDVDLWNVDDAGVTAQVKDEFIPLSAIDVYKPIFWPEAFGICNTAYWHDLVQAIMEHISAE